MSPQSFRPQLATLVGEAPRGEEWLHEIKFDGYRIGCLVEGGTARLISRNGNDWTARFPTIAEAVRPVRARSAILDGEIAVVLPDGRTSFQELQNAFGKGPARNVVYFVFDPAGVGRQRDRGAPARGAEEAARDARSPSAGRARPLCRPHRR